MPEKHSKETLGVDCVIFGDVGDFEKVKMSSSEHDIAVNAGNSFTADPVAAIIAGQKVKKRRVSRHRHSHQR